MKENLKKSLMEIKQKYTSPISVTSDYKEENIVKSSCFDVTNTTQTLELTKTTNQPHVNTVQESKTTSKKNMAIEQIDEESFVATSSEVAYGQTYSVSGASVYQVTLDDTTSIEEDISEQRNIPFGPTPKLKRPSEILPITDKENVTVPQEYKLTQDKVYTIEESTGEQQPQIPQKGVLSERQLREGLKESLKKIRQTAQNSKPLSESLSIDHQVTEQHGYSGFIRERPHSSIRGPSFIALKEQKVFMGVKKVYGTPTTEAPKLTFRKPKMPVVQKSSEDNMKSIISETKQALKRTQISRRHLKGKLFIKPFITTFKHYFPTDKPIVHKLGSVNIQESNLRASSEHTTTLSKNISNTIVEETVTETVMKSTYTKDSVTSEEVPINTSGMRQLEENEMKNELRKTLTEIKKKHDKGVVTTISSDEAYGSKVTPLHEAPTREEFKGNLLRIQKKYDEDITLTKYEKIVLKTLTPIHDIIDDITDESFEDLQHNLKIAAANFQEENVDYSSSTVTPLNEAQIKEDLKKSLMLIKERHEKNISSVPVQYYSSKQGLHKTLRRIHRKYEEDIMLTRYEKSISEVLTPIQHTINEMTEETFGEIQRELKRFEELKDVTPLEEKQIKEELKKSLINIKMKHDLQKYQSEQRHLLLPLTSTPTSTTIPIQSLSTKQELITQMKQIRTKCRQQQLLTKTENIILEHLAPIEHIIDEMTDETFAELQLSLKSIVITTDETDNFPTTSKVTPLNEDQLIENLKKSLKIIKKKHELSMVTKQFAVPEEVHQMYPLARPIPCSSRGELSNNLKKIQRKYQEDVALTKIEQIMFENFVPLEHTINEMSDDTFKSLQETVMATTNLIEDQNHNYVTSSIKPINEDKIKTELKKSLIEIKRRHEEEVKKTGRTEPLRIGESRELLPISHEVDVYTSTSIPVQYVSTPHELTKNLKIIEKKYEEDLTLSRVEEVVFETFAPIQHTLNRMSDTTFRSLQQSLRLFTIRGRDHPKSRSTSLSEDKIKADLKRSLINIKKRHENDMKKHQLSAIPHDHNTEPIIPVDTGKVIPISSTKDEQASSYSSSLTPQQYCSKKEELTKTLKRIEKKYEEDVTLTTVERIIYQTLAPVQHTINEMTDETFGSLQQSITLATGNDKNERADYTTTFISPLNEDEMKKGLKKSLIEIKKKHERETKIIRRDERDEPMFPIEHRKVLPITSTEGDKIQPVTSSMTPLSYFLTDDDVLKNLSNIELTQNEEVIFEKLVPIQHMIDEMVEKSLILGTEISKKQPKNYTTSILTPVHQDIQDTLMTLPQVHEDDNRNNKYTTQILHLTLNEAVYPTESSVALPISNTQNEIFDTCTSSLTPVQFCSTRDKLSENLQKIQSKHKKGIHLTQIEKVILHTLAPVQHTIAEMAEDTFEKLQKCLSLATTSTQNERKDYKASAVTPINEDIQKTLVEIVQGHKDQINKKYTTPELHLTLNEPVYPTESSVALPISSTQNEIFDTCTSSLTPVQFCSTRDELSENLQKIQSKHKKGIHLTQIEKVILHTLAPVQHTIAEMAEDTFAKLQKCISLATTSTQNERKDYKASAVTPINEDIQKTLVEIVQGHKDQINKKYTTPELHLTLNEPVYPTESSVALPISSTQNEIFDTCTSSLTPVQFCSTRDELSENLQKIQSKHKKGIHLTQIEKVILHTLAPVQHTIAEMAEDTFAKLQKCISLATTSTQNERKDYKASAVTPINEDIQKTLVDIVQGHKDQINKKYTTPELHLTLNEPVYPTESSVALPISSTQNEIFDTCTSSLTPVQFCSTRDELSENLQKIQSKHKKGIHLTQIEKVILHTLAPVQHTIAEMAEDTFAKLQKCISLATTSTQNERKDYKASAVTPINEDIQKTLVDIVQGHKDQINKKYTTPELHLTLNEPVYPTESSVALPISSTQNEIFDTCTSSLTPVQFCSTRDKLSENLQKIQSKHKKGIHLTQIEKVILHTLAPVQHTIAEMAEDTFAKLQKCLSLATTSPQNERKDYKASAVTPINEDIQKTLVDIVQGHKDQINKKYTTPELHLTLNEPVYPTESSVALPISSTQNEIFDTCTSSLTPVQFCSTRDKLSENLQKIQSKHKKGIHLTQIEKVILHTLAPVQHTIAEMAEDTFAKLQKCLSLATTSTQNERKDYKASAVTPINEDIQKTLVDIVQGHKDQINKKYTTPELHLTLNEPVYPTESSVALPISSTQNEIFDTCTSSLTPVQFCSTRDKLSENLQKIQSKHKKGIHLTQIEKVILHTLAPVQHTIAEMAEDTFEKLQKCLSLATTSTQNERKDYKASAVTPINEDIQKTLVEIVQGHKDQINKKYTTPELHLTLNEPVYPTESSVALPISSTQNEIFDTCTSSLTPVQFCSTRDELSENLQKIQSKHKKGIHLTQIEKVILHTLAPVQHTIAEMAEDTFAKLQKCISLATTSTQNERKDYKASAVTPINEDIQKTLVDIVQGHKDQINKKYTTPELHLTLNEPVYPTESSVALPISSTQNEIFDTCTSSLTPVQFCSTRDKLSENLQKIQSKHKKGIHLTQIEKVILHTLAPVQHTIAEMAEDTFAKLQKCLSLATTSPQNERENYKASAVTPINEDIQKTLVDIVQGHKDQINKKYTTPELHLTLNEPVYPTESSVALPISSTQNEIFDTCTSSLTPVQFCSTRDKLSENLQKIQSKHKKGIHLTQIEKVILHTLAPVQHTIAEMAEDTFAKLQKCLSLATTSPQNERENYKASAVTPINEDIQKTLVDIVQGHKDQINKKYTTPELHLTLNEPVYPTESSVALPISSTQNEIFDTCTSSLTPVQFCSTRDKLSENLQKIQSKHKKGIHLTQIEKVILHTLAPVQHTIAEMAEDTFAKLQKCLSLATTSPQNERENYKASAVTPINEDIQKTLVDIVQGHKDQINKKYTTPELHLTLNEPVYPTESSVALPISSTQNEIFDTCTSSLTPVQFCSTRDELSENLQKIQSKHKKGIHLTQIEKVILHTLAPVQHTIAEMAEDTFAKLQKCISLATTSTQNERENYKASAVTPINEDIQKTLVDIVQGHKDQINKKYTTPELHLTLNEPVYPTESSVALPISSTQNEIFDTCTSSLTPVQFCSTRDKLSENLQKIQSKHKKGIHLTQIEKVILHTLAPVQHTIAEMAEDTFAKLQKCLSLATTSPQNERENYKASAVTPINEDIQKTLVDIVQGHKDQINKKYTTPELHLTLNEPVYPTESSVALPISSTQNEIFDTCTSSLTPVQFCSTRDKLSENLQKIQSKHKKGIHLTQIEKVILHTLAPVQHTIAEMAEDTFAKLQKCLSLATTSTQNERKDYKASAVTPINEDIQKTLVDIVQGHKDQINKKYTTPELHLTLNEPVYPTESSVALPISSTQNEIFDTCTSSLTPVQFCSTRDKLSENLQKIQSKHKKGIHLTQIEKVILHTLAPVQHTIAEMAEDTFAKLQKCLSLATTSPQNERENYKASAVTPINEDIQKTLVEIVQGHKDQINKKYTTPELHLTLNEPVYPTESSVALPISSTQNEIFDTCTSSLTPVQFCSTRDKLSENLQKIQSKHKKGIHLTQIEKVILHTLAPVQHTIAEMAEDTFAKLQKCISLATTSTQNERENYKASAVTPINEDIQKTLVDIVQGHKDQINKKYTTPELHLTLNEPVYPTESSVALPISSTQNEIFDTCTSSLTPVQFCSTRDKLSENLQKIQSKHKKGIHLTQIEKVILHTLAPVQHTIAEMAEDTFAKLQKCLSLATTSPQNERENYKASAVTPINEDIQKTLVDIVQGHKDQINKKYTTPELHLTLNEPVYPTESSVALPISSTQNEIFDTCTSSLTPVQFCSTRDKLSENLQKIQSKHKKGIHLTQIEKVILHTLAPVQHTIAEMAEDTFAKLQKCLSLATTSPQNERENYKASAVTPINEDIQKTLVDIVQGHKDQINKKYTTPELHLTLNEPVYPTESSVALPISSTQNEIFDTCTSSLTPVQFCSTRDKLSENLQKIQSKHKKGIHLTQIEKVILHTLAPVQHTIAEMAEDTFAKLQKCLSLATTSPQNERENYKASAVTPINEDIQKTLVDIVQGHKDQINKKYTTPELHLTLNEPVYPTESSVALPISSTQNEIFDTCTSSLTPVQFCSTRDKLSENLQKIQSKHKKGIHLTQIEKVILHTLAPVQHTIAEMAEDTFAKLQKCLSLATTSPQNERENYKASAVTPINEDIQKTLVDIVQGHKDQINKKYTTPELHLTLNEPVYPTESSVALPISSTQNEIFDTCTSSLTPVQFCSTRDKLSENLQKIQSKHKKGIHLTQIEKVILHTLAPVQHTIAEMAEDTFAKLQKCLSLATTSPQNERENYKASAVTPINEDIQKTLVDIVQGHKDQINKKYTTPELHLTLNEPVYPTESSVALPISSTQNEIFDTCTSSLTPVQFCSTRDKLSENLQKIQSKHKKGIHLTQIEKVILHTLAPVQHTIAEMAEDTFAKLQKCLSLATTSPQNERENYKASAVTPINEDIQKTLVDIVQGHKDQINKKYTTPELHLTLNEPVYPTESSVALPISSTQNEIFDTCTSSLTPVQFCSTRDKLSENLQKIQSKHKKGIHLTQIEKVILHTLAPVQHTIAEMAEDTFAKLQKCLSLATTSPQNERENYKASAVTPINEDIQKTLVDIVQGHKDQINKKYTTPELHLTLNEPVYPTESSVALPISSTQNEIFDTCTSSLTPVQFCSTRDKLSENLQKIQSKHKKGIHLTQIEKVILHTLAPVQHTIAEMAEDTFAKLQKCLSLATTSPQNERENYKASAVTPINEDIQKTLVDIVQGHKDQINKKYTTPELHLTLNEPVYPTESSVALPISSTQNEIFDTCTSSLTPVQFCSTRDKLSENLQKIQSKHKKGIHLTQIEKVILHTLAPVQHTIAEMAEDTFAKLQKCLSLATTSPQNERENYKASAVTPINEDIQKTLVDIVQGHKDQINKKYTTPELHLTLNEPVYPTESSVALPISSTQNEIFDTCTSSLTPVQFCSTRDKLSENLQKIQSKHKKGIHLTQIEKVILHTLAPVQHTIAEMAEDTFAKLQKCISLATTSTQNERKDYKASAVTPINEDIQKTLVDIVQGHKDQINKKYTTPELHLTLNEPVYPTVDTHDTQHNKHEKGDQIQEKSVEDTQRRLVTSTLIQYCSTPEELTNTLKSIEKKYDKNVGLSEIDKIIFHTLAPILHTIDRMTQETFEEIQQSVTLAASRKDEPDTDYTISSVWPLNEDKIKSELKKSLIEIRKRHENEVEIMKKHQLPGRALPISSTEDDRVDTCLSSPLPIQLSSTRDEFVKVLRRIRKKHEEDVTLTDVEKIILETLVPIEHTIDDMTHETFEGIKQSVTIATSRIEKPNTDYTSSSVWPLNEEKIKSELKKSLIEFRKRHEKEVEIMKKHQLPGRALPISSTEDDKIDTCLSSPLPIQVSSTRDEFVKVLRRIRKKHEEDVTLTDVEKIILETLVPIEHTIDDMTHETFEGIKQSVTIATSRIEKPNTDYTSSSVWPLNEEKIKSELKKSLIEIRKRHEKEVEIMKKHQLPGRALPISSTEDDRVDTCLSSPLPIQLSSTREEFVKSLRRIRKKHEEDVTLTDVEKIILETLVPMEHTIDDMTHETFERIKQSVTIATSRIEKPNTDYTSSSVWPLNEEKIKSELKKSLIEFRKRHEKEVEIMKKHQLPGRALPISSTEDDKIDTCLSSPLPIQVSSTRDEFVKVLRRIRKKHEEDVTLTDVEKIILETLVPIEHTIDDMTHETFEGIKQSVTIATSRIEKPNTDYTSSSVWPLNEEKIKSELKKSLIEIRKRHEKEVEIMKKHQLPGRALPISSTEDDRVDTCLSSPLPIQLSSTREEFVKSLRRIRKKHEEDVTLTDVEKIILETLVPMEHTIDDMTHETFERIKQSVTIATSRIEKPNTDYTSSSVWPLNEEKIKSELKKSLIEFRKRHEKEVEIMKKHQLPGRALPISSTEDDKIDTCLSSPLPIQVSSTRDEFVKVLRRIRKKHEEDVTLTDVEKIILETLVPIEHTIDDMTHETFEGIKQSVTIATSRIEKPNTDYTSSSVWPLNEEKIKSKLKKSLIEIRKRHEKEVEIMKKHQLPGRALPISSTEDDKIDTCLSSPLPIQVSSTRDEFVKVLRRIRKKHEEDVTLTDVEKIILETLVPIEHTIDDMTHETFEGIKQSVTIATSIIEKPNTDYTSSSVWPLNEEKIKSELKKSLIGIKKRHEKEVEIRKNHSFSVVSHDALDYEEKPFNLTETGRVLPILSTEDERVDTYLSSPLPIQVSSTRDEFVKVLRRIRKKHEEDVTLTDVEKIILETLVPIEHTIDDMTHETFEGIKQSVTIATSRIEKPNTDYTSSSVWPLNEEKIKSELKKSLIGIKKRHEKEVEIRKNHSFSVVSHDALDNEEKPFNLTETGRALPILSTEDERVDTYLSSPLPIQVSSTRDEFVKVLRRIRKKHEEDVTLTDVEKIILETLVPIEHTIDDMTHETFEGIKQSVTIATSRIEKPNTDYTSSSVWPLNEEKIKSELKKSLIGIKKRHEKEVEIRKNHSFSVVSHDALDNEEKPFNLTETGRALPILSTEDERVDTYLSSPLPIQVSSTRDEFVKVLRRIRKKHEEDVTLTDMEKIILETLVPIEHTIDDMTHETFEGIKQSVTIATSRIEKPNTDYTSSSVWPLNEEKIKSELKKSLIGIKKRHEKEVEIRKNHSFSVVSHDALDNEEKPFNLTETGRALPILSTEDERVDTYLSSPLPIQISSTRDEFVKVLRRIRKKHEEDVTLTDMEKIILETLVPIEHTIDDMTHETFEGIKQSVTIATSRIEKPNTDYTSSSVWPLNEEKIKEELKKSLIKIKRKHENDVKIQTTSAVSQDIEDNKYEALSPEEVSKSIPIVSTEDDMVYAHTSSCTPLHYCSTHEELVRTVKEVQKKYENNETLTAIEKIIFECLVPMDEITHDMFVSIQQSLVLATSSVQGQENDYSTSSVSVVNKDKIKEDLKRSLLDIKRKHAKYPEQKTPVVSHVTEDYRSEPIIPIERSQVLPSLSTEDSQTDTYFASLVPVHHLSTKDKLVKSLKDIQKKYVEDVTLTKIEKIILKTLAPIQHTIDDMTNETFESLQKTLQLTMNSIQEQERNYTTSIITPLNEPKIRDEIQKFLNKIEKKDVEDFVVTPIKPSIQQRLDDSTESNLESVLAETKQRLRRPLRLQKPEKYQPETYQLKPVTIEQKVLEQQNVKYSLKGTVLPKPSRSTISETKEVLIETKRVAPINVSIDEQIDYNIIDSVRAKEDLPFSITEEEMPDLVSSHEIQVCQPHRDQRIVKDLKKSLKKIRNDYEGRFLLRK